MQRRSLAPLRPGATEAAQFRRRALFSGIVVTLLMLGLALGYGRLQILEHAHYATRSDENRIRIEPVMPARGLIFDRNGVLLADNVPAYRLDIVPERVDDLPALLDELGRRVALDDDDLRRFEQVREGGRRFRPVTLKPRLDEQEVARLAVDAHRFPGVEVVPYLTRHYPFGALTAHVVGYVGRLDEEDMRRLTELGEQRFARLPHRGRTGIERYHETRLRGEPGFKEVETNAENRPLRVLRRHESRPGQNLYLSLDIRLQQAMVEAFAGQHGAAVAIDPATGGILAMVSLPAFDPNRFVAGLGVAEYRALSTDPSRPLFNRNVLGGFPPGSTLKPFLALTGLQHGSITPESTVLSTGAFRLPGHDREYRDWKPGGHGRVDLVESLAQSVNTYYFELAMALGIDLISSDLARFGFGAPTGIDLVGESSGVLPSRAWKQRRFGQPWFPGETVIAGIGQGYWVTTPLQLAQATALLANGGHLRRPRLLQAYQPATGGPPVTLPESEPVARRIEPRHLAAVHAGLVATMHGPTGTALAVSAGAPFRMAGKTGTAQRVGRQGTERIDPDLLPLHLRHQALFIGYAPAEAPSIAVVVVVEQGGSGARTAAPVARRIFDAWLAP